MLVHGLGGSAESWTYDTRGKAYVYPMMYIRNMVRIIKLQKVGNSIRAIIPKEVAENLSLSEGQEVVVDTEDETVIIKKKAKHGMVQFYGVLSDKKERMEDWPTPEEIKSIWE